MLDELSAVINDNAIEIEINDYGILNRINKSDSIKKRFRYRAGRLLDKSFHDGRLDERELERLFIKSEIRWQEDSCWISEHMAKVLINNDLKGFDIDLPAGKIEFKKNNNSLNIGLFVPYSYITTGGICLMKNIDKPIESKFDLSDNTCSFKCREYYEIMKKRVIDIHEDNPKLDDGYNLKDTVFYRAGNTIFYLREEQIRAISLSGSIGRLIFEPKLML